MQIHFDDELTGLKSDILKMGAMVEDAIFKSVESLKNLDAEGANKVISDDKQVDELELKIEDKCLDLLALRQPMAVDLRFITMTMKITTELERMADLAVDIAQRVLDIVDKPLLKPLVDIPKLTAIAQEMTNKAINALVNKDGALAGSVIMMDAEADNLRNVVQQELINDYMARDPKTATRAVPLLLIARHLERICDHATNIAEEVIYLSSAKIVKHHPEKLDQTIDHRL
ncbi:MAG: phosphate signaling complex protein PhoU [Candidatus Omnitrophica bacterium]|nr:phosphate signaling complex protein PhoU [Candidatus Omnitrophota bacterium]